MQFAQLTTHEMPELGIERTQRLVHQKCLRTPNHRAPQRDPLAVAAGQFRRLARQQMLDAQKPCCLQDPLANVAAPHALALERKADVLGDIHMRIKRKHLEHESDVAGGSAPECDILAVEQNASTRRQLEPGDHAQCRRLAAT